MSAIENLFRIRTAEQAQTDNQFLALFSGGVVKALPANDVWDRLVRIESAPGGGKTSLLRLFTPLALVKIYRTRKTPDVRELYRELVELGAVVDGQGPAVLGVLVNCHHDYSRIAEHDLDPSDKLIWFMSLLDARVTLLVLRAALQLAGLRYPADVDRLTLVRKADGMPGPLVSDDIPGRKLFEECRDTEQRIGERNQSIGSTAVFGGTADTFRGRATAHESRIAARRSATHRASFVDVRRDAYARGEAASGAGTGSQES